MKLPPPHHGGGGPFTSPLVVIKKFQTEIWSGPPPTMMGGGQLHLLTSGNARKCVKKLLGDFKTNTELKKTRKFRILYQFRRFKG